MNQIDRIQLDPAVCHGQPVIRGTQVPVTILVGSLAAGMTMEDIQFEYGVSREDIQAALAYANELLQQESFHGFFHEV